MVGSGPAVDSERYFHTNSVFAYRNIVDTEPFQGGNLLKMLLGAISEWYDDDEPDRDYQH